MAHLLSDDGFRIDGRRPNELRQIRSNIGVYKQADGSAYLEQGNTKVLATVYGPHEVRAPKRSLHNQAIINCQFSMAVFSTPERKNRPRGDRRSLEMTRHLEQTFRVAVLTTLYPRSQIDIYVEVLESDGNAFPVCVNAASLALIDAGIAMKDIVCSCTVADLDLASGEGSTAVIDVNRFEDHSNVLTITYLIKSKQVVKLQLKGRLHEDRLGELLEAAEIGCEQLHKILETAIQEHVKKHTSSIECCS